jgi:DNA-binding MarR family transcriptional regulator
MFPKLDPLLHSELRLAVMSVLAGVESADFTFLKALTGATAGNLSVQIDKLATAGYIAVEKGFKGKMPCTTCRITPEGVEAFDSYVSALREYLSAGQA